MKIFDRSPSGLAANFSKIKFSQQENQPQTLTLFIHKIDTYGVGCVVLNLAEEFAALGWHIDLVVCEDNGELQSALSERIRLIVLKTQRAASNPPLKGVFELSHYLKLAKPKFIISFLHYNNEIAILAKYLSREPVKVIVTDHSVLSKTTATAIKKTRKLIPFIARFLYPFADGIVAVSQAVKADLAKLLKLQENRIQVIYNPIINRSIIQESRSNVDHSWFTVKDRPIILAVGRLAPEKDFPTLIHAFAKLRQTQLARLVILGDGLKESYTASLAQMVNQLGLTDDVLFQGLVKNPYAYMAKSDVLVVSSLWEGLSNVVIEAMALNLPVVATRCGGPVELLAQGKYGTLVPVGNPLAMAEAIAATLSQQNLPVSQEWLTQFTSSIVASQYLDLCSIQLQEQQPFGTPAQQSITLNPVKQSANSTCFFHRNRSFHAVPKDGAVEKLVGLKKTI
jgi:glycosyltransferase involved in cell wall biosynthesis